MLATTLSALASPTKSPTGEEIVLTKEQAYFLHLVVDSFYGDKELADESLDRLTMWESGVLEGEVTYEEVQQSLAALESEGGPSFAPEDDIDFTPARPKTLTFPCL